MPWYLRSGKCLPETATEVLVELKPPPQKLFADATTVSCRSNYVRFRLSPNSALALAARVKQPGQEFIGEQRELYLLEQQPGEEKPYERLLGDAMNGEGALFTREDAVEAAWAVVNPSSRTTPGFVLTDLARGDPKRQTPFLTQAAVGITPAPKLPPDADCAIPRFSQVPNTRYQHPVPPVSRPAVVGVS